MNKSFYNDPSSHNTPLPLYMVDQIVLWELKREGLGTIGGGMGRVISARYCVNEKIGNFWQYYIRVGYGETQLETVNEDKIVNSIPV